MAYVDANGNITDQWGKPTGQKYVTPGMAPQQVAQFMQMQNLGNTEMANRRADPSGYLRNTYDWMSKAIGNQTFPEVNNINPQVQGMTKVGASQFMNPFLQYGAAGNDPGTWYSQGLPAWKQTGTYTPQFSGGNIFGQGGVGNQFLNQAAARATGSTVAPVTTPAPSRPVTPSPALPPRTAVGTGGGVDIGLRTNPQGTSAFQIPIGSDRGRPTMISAPSLPRATGGNVAVASTRPAEDVPDSGGTGDTGVPWVPPPRTGGTSTTGGYTPTSTTPTNGLPWGQIGGEGNTEGQQQFLNAISQWMLPYITGQPGIPWNDLAGSYGQTFSNWNNALNMPQLQQGLAGISGLNMGMLGNSENWLNNQFLPGMQQNISGLANQSYSPTGGYNPQNVNQLMSLLATGTGQMTPGGTQDYGLPGMLSQIYNRGLGNQWAVEKNVGQFMGDNPYNAFGTWGNALEGPKTAADWLRQQYQTQFGRGNEGLDVLANLQRSGIFSPSKNDQVFNAQSSLANNADYLQNYARDLLAGGGTTIDQLQQMMRNMPGREQITGLIGSQLGQTAPLQAGVNENLLRQLQGGVPGTPEIQNMMKQAASEWQTGSLTPEQVQALTRLIYNPMQEQLMGTINKQMGGTASLGSGVSAELQRRAMQDWQDRLLTKALETRPQAAQTALGALSGLTGANLPVQQLAAQQGQQGIGNALAAFQAVPQTMLPFLQTGGNLANQMYGTQSGLQQALGQTGAGIDANQLARQAAYGQTAGQQIGTGSNMLQQLLAASGQLGGMAQYGLNYPMQAMSGVASGVAPYAQIGANLMTQMPTQQMNQYQMAQNLALQPYQAATDNYLRSMGMQQQGQGTMLDAMLKFLTSQQQAGQFPQQLQNNTLQTLLGGIYGGNAAQLAADQQRMNMFGQMLGSVLGGINFGKGTSGGGWTVAPNISIGGGANDRQSAWDYMMDPNNYGWYDPFRVGYIGSEAG